MISLLQTHNISDTHQRPNNGWGETGKCKLQVLKANVGHVTLIFTSKHLSVYVVTFRINCCVNNRLMFIQIPIYVEYSKHTDSYVRMRVENGFQKPVSDGCESF